MKHFANIVSALLLSGAACFAAIGFFRGQPRPPISGDIGAAFDRPRREQAEARKGTADAEETRHGLRLAAESILVARHGA